MNQQELFYQAQMIQQQSEEIEQHLQFVQQQLEELSKFKENIAALKENTEKGMLAPLGKGVYIKTEIAEKKLFVEVGNGVIVRKTPEEVETILDSQVKSLQESKIYLARQADAYTGALHEILHKFEQSQMASKAEK